MIEKDVLCKQKAKGSQSDYFNIKVSFKTRTIIRIKKAIRDLEDGHLPRRHTILSRYTPNKETLHKIHEAKTYLFFFF